MGKIPRYKRRLSTTQIVCLVVLWFLLAYIVLVSAEQIDGILVVTLLISGVLVLIPIYKELQRRKEENK